MKQKAGKSSSNSPVNIRGIKGKIGVIHQVVALNSTVVVGGKRIKSHFETKDADEEYTDVKRCSRRRKSR